MTRREILTCRYGEMLDMISCLAVYNGSAALKRGSVRNFDKTLEVI